MRVNLSYNFQDLPETNIPTGFEAWLNEVSLEYKRSFNLQFIFCCDDFLFEMNKKHLQHNTYTDIITFDLSTIPSRVEGEIFISVDRVKDNSMKEDVSFATELARVMSHGVFHLLGFGDKTPEERLKMRELEGAAIEQILDVSRETKNK